MRQLTSSRRWNGSCARLSVLWLLRNCGQFVVRCVTVFAALQRMRTDRQMQTVIHPCHCHNVLAVLHVYEATGWYQQHRKRPPDSHLFSDEMRRYHEQRSTKPQDTAACEWATSGPRVLSIKWYALDALRACQPHSQCLINPFWKVMKCGV